VPKRKRKAGTKKISIETTEKSETKTKKKPSRKVFKEKAEPTSLDESDSEVRTEIRSDIKHGFISIPAIWPDHLTKYERSRIIGARALQISMGAPILIEELEILGNPVEVAEKELEYGILPITIRRIFPDGEIIDVPLKDLLEND